MKTTLKSIFVCLATLLISVSAMAKKTKKLTIPQKPAPADTIVAGHTAVDLGLTVLWANTNVGASSPELCGEYYAWGEVKPKQKYFDDNTLTFSYNYEDLIRAEIIDSTGALTLSRDVAAKQWGSDWRMPTWSEMAELWVKCQWKWTAVDGVKGYRVTGPSGNSIFLPAYGQKVGLDTELSGAYGYYWSATANKEKADCCSYGLFFMRSDNGLFSLGERYKGRLVRPVIPRSTDKK